MLHLSERAQRYMENLPFERNYQWVSDERDVFQYLHKNDMPVSEAFITYQLHCSGHTLTFNSQEAVGDGRGQFDMFLFNREDMNRGNGFCLINILKSAV